MKNHSKRAHLLRLALFFSILGSGITWTGLSYELSINYSDPGLMSLMQIISTIAGLAGPMALTFFSLNMNPKSLLIFTDIISSICFIIIYFILSIASPDSLFNFSATITILFCAMLLGAIQNIYFEPLYASCIASKDNRKHNLTRQFAAIGSYITFGKLLGMGLGPLIFSTLHYYALLINSITFLISAYLFKTSISKFIKKNVSLEIKNKFKFNYHLIFDRVFLEGSIASSLIYIVVIFISVKLVALNASAITMSIYWISATICALVSQLLLSKSIRMHQLLIDLDKQAGFILCIPIIAVFFTDNLSIMIVCQMIFSIFNPVSRNSARTHFYQHFGEHNQSNNIYAMRELSSQIIILIFSLMLASQYSNYTLFLCTSGISILIILRWLFSKHELMYVKTV